MDTDANPDNGAPEPSAAPPNPDPRRCNYLRDNGNYCGSWKMNASERGWCAGHEGRGIAGDPALQALGTPTSAARRTARAQVRKMGMKELIAAELEENAAEWLKPYRLARDNGDYNATDRLMAWTYGKPRETVETITTGALDALTDEQLEQRAAELRARMHAVDTSAQAA